jgi:hypothetical protein
MFRPLLPAIWLLFAWPAAEACAACPAPVSVEGTPDEAGLACDQYAAVQAYFAGLGFEAAPAVRVKFEETVHLSESPGSYAVTGEFIPDEDLIEMTSPDSKAPARILHWQQPWSREMAASVLEHELVHAFVNAIVPSPLARAWNEFVAYAVQFELMQPALRRNILAAYPKAEPYDQKSSVCDLSYLLDFDLFGLRAYLTTEAGGGPNYIKQILSGSIPTGAPRRFECR